MATKSFSATLYTSVRSQVWAYFAEYLQGAATLNSTSTLTCGVKKYTRITSTILAESSYTSPTFTRILTGVNSGNRIQLSMPATLGIRLPTGVNIDFSKLGLSLAQGADYVIKLEQGFVQETEGMFSLLPANDNLISFRTPKLFNSAVTSSSTFYANSDANWSGRATLAGAMTFVVRGNLRPANGVAIENTQFIMVPTAAKRVRGMSGISSAFAIYSNGGHLRSAQATIGIVSFNLVEKYNDGRFIHRIRDNNIAMTATFTTSTSGYVFEGIVKTLPVTATMNINAVKSIVNAADISAQSILTSSPVKTPFISTSLNSFATVVNTRIDDYPYDYLKTLNYNFYGAIGNESAYLLKTNGSIDFIYNVATGSTNNNPQGAWLGATSDKFITYRNTGYNLYNDYINIWNYSGTSLGTISNPSDLVDFGSSHTNGIGSDYAYISWENYSGTANPQTAYKVFTLATNANTSLPSAVTSETRQRLECQNNTYAGFGHSSITSPAFAYRIINKNTNTVVRTISFTGVGGPSSAKVSMLAISNNYYVIQSTYSPSGVNPYIRVYSMSTGNAVYALTGATDMGRYLGIDDNNIYLTTSDPNKVEIVSLTTGLKIGSFVGPNGNSSQLLYVATVNNQLIFTVYPDPGKNQSWVYDDSTIG